MHVIGQRRRCAEPDMASAEQYDQASEQSILRCAIGYRIALNRLTCW